MFLQLGKKKSVPDLGCMMGAVKCYRSTYPPTTGDVSFPVSVCKGPINFLIPEHFIDYVMGSLSESSQHETKSFCFTQRMIWISSSTWRWCCVSVVVIGRPLRAWSCRLIMDGLSPFSLFRPPYGNDIYTDLQSMLIVTQPSAIKNSITTQFSNYFTMDVVILLSSMCICHILDGCCCISPSHFIRDYHHIGSMYVRELLS